MDCQTTQTMKVYGVGKGTSDFAAVQQNYSINLK